MTVQPGRGGPSMDPETRSRFATAFQSGGELYDRVRPGYPTAMADWLIPAQARDVLDLGAGTGKFTQRLVAAGLNVTAMDSSTDMLSQLAARLPRVTVAEGSAEHTGLLDHSVDAVFVAQAWHWFDAQAASAEIARILRPSGALSVVSNQLDVSLPWVHRLSRIMHAGDVHRPGYRPELGPQFAPWQTHEVRWAQSLLPKELLELMKSRSYYLKAGPHVRERMEHNLHWYLFENLGHKPGWRLELPYVTQGWRSSLN